MVFKKKLTYNINNLLYFKNKIIPPTKDEKIFKKINTRKKCEIFVYSNKINFKYHLKELRDRVSISGLTFISSTLICFFYSKEIIKIIQLIGLKKNISFLQLAPGDFFFTSVDVGLCFGILCSVPSILYQIASYLIPGLTIREKNFFVLITISSIILFMMGIIFSCDILSPYALNFFLEYSENSVEATISIKQYFEFFIELFFITGLAFQVDMFFFSYRYFN